MDATQASKFAMYHAVVDLFDDSTALTATIPAVSATLTTLRTELDAIPALANAQIQPTSGVTTDKQAAFAAMAQATLAVGAGVAAYADQHQLGDLAAHANVTATALAAGRAVDRLTLAEQVHAAANGVIAALADFGVTPTDLTALATSIETARSMLSAPRGVTGAKRSATEQLVDAFDRIDGLLARRLDPLATKLGNNNPDFLGKYEAARVIVDHPGGHATPEAPPLAPVVSPPNEPNPPAPSVPKAA